MALVLRHPAGKPRSLASSVVLRAASLTMAVLALSACETNSFSNISDSGEHRASRLAENGQHNDAAGEYIGLAAVAIGSERDRLTLLAIEQWLDAGDANRAGRALRSVAKPSPGPYLPMWNTNMAALSLYQGDADAALSLLEPTSRQSLSQRDRLRVEALRADAWIQKQDPARAVELMTQREIWIDDASGIEQNRQRLWQGLLVSNPQVLREAAQNADNSETRGWLALASLSTSTGQQGIGWNNGVARWQNGYPGHPAFGMTDSSQSFNQKAMEYPRQVALLLPLSGRSASSGRAIQNGFLGAYFSTASALDEQQSVRIYDINSEGGASAAYQTAVADGAEFVVGPLVRKSVDELANDTLVPVPVLTLNYLSEDSLAPPGLYQFALAPEDEAASAAQRALGDSYTRAVALIPDNDWGRRVLRSFAAEFKGLGGTLLDYRSYSPEKQDFSNEIETLMGLSESVQRYTRIRANIDTSLQFDPRRRQDAEFIFLAAAAGAGRLLKSQLKFHYSGDLPVYSTSSVNSLDGRSNSDLNGVMFSETPWLIDPQPWIQALPDTYAKHWPQERRLGRLHAMGYDAYNLIAALYENRGEMAEIDGATGTLFLDQNGRVHRRLVWAQFQRGEAVALPAQEKFSGPILDISNDGELIAPNAADKAQWGRPQQDQ